MRPRSFIFFFLFAFTLPSWGKSRCSLLSSDVGANQSLNSKVDFILVGKEQRKMLVLSGQNILKSYRVSLGFEPSGAKTQEGDGRTPEGLYHIDFKNDRSAYHLALRVSYPNENDVAFARSLGVPPGGNIMIHGFPKDPGLNVVANETHDGNANWTQGCIAVRNQEIEELFPLVDEGTPIEICP